MRCPKCGYISFDHLETCKKCQKNIADVVAEIKGTVYDAEPPLFLQLATDGRFQVPDSSSQITNKNEKLADNIPDIDLQEPAGIDTDFIFDEGAIEEFPRNTNSLPDSSDDLIMEMDDFSEVSPREEYTLELSEDRGEIELKGPALDFGDLDISDLAPPVKEQSDNTPQFAEELVLAETEPVAALSEYPPQLPKAATKSAKSQGLEDLNFNGLDLDAPAKIVTGSAAGKRYLPSVKTGTALDKFDIDLGDLFAGDKK